MCLGQPRNCNEYQTFPSHKGEKKPKKQIKDTASVKANQVHFLISALISQKSLQEFILLRQPDGEGDKADE